MVMPSDAQIVQIEQRLIASEDPELRAKGLAMRYQRQGTVAPWHPGPEQLVPRKVTPPMVESRPEIDTSYDWRKGVAGMVEPPPSITDPYAGKPPPAATSGPLLGRTQFGEQVTSTVPPRRPEARRPMPEPGALRAPGRDALGSTLQKVQDLQEKQAERAETFQGELDKILGRRQAALESAAAIGAQQAEAERAQKEVALSEIRDLDAANVEKEQRRQKALTMAADDLKSSWAEVSSYKIDPYRDWGVGRSILAAIGVALASYGGNSGAAMAFINRSIDREVQAQKAELGKLKAKVDFKRNLYAMQAARHDDERAAESAAKMLMKAQLGQQLDLIASKYKAPQIQQRAAEMKETIAREAMLDRERFLAAKEDQAMRTYQVEAGIIGQRASLAQQREAMTARVASAQQGTTGKKLNVDKVSKLLTVPKMIGLLEEAWTAHKKGRFGPISSNIAARAGMGSEAAQFDDITKYLAVEIEKATTVGTFSDEDAARAETRAPTAGMTNDRGDNRMNMIRRKAFAGVVTYIDTARKLGYNVEPLMDDYTAALEEIIGDQTVTTQQ